MELTINKTFPSQYKKELYYIIGEDADGNEHKIKGKFNIDLDIGDMIHVSRYTQSGEYLECEAYEKIRDKNISYIYNFLVSEVEGIGAKTADVIVKKFGEKTIDIFENEPTQLLGIGKIGQERMFKFSDSYKSVPEEKRKFMLIGLSAIVAEKAMSKFYYADVVNNPYRLLEIEGVGWIKADNIAVKGLAYDTMGEYRLFSAVNEVMRVTTEAHGNTYIEVEELIKKTCELLFLNYEENQNIISGVIQRMQAV
jgi:exodeoxyribonuclease V alpha subunit